MRIFFSAASAALMIAAVAPAFGQTVDDHRPIVGGKDIQPRLPPTQQPTDPNPSPLLQTQGDNGPIVQPKDIYGNPLDNAQDPPPPGPAKAH
jgi:hypothetical protein